MTQDLSEHKKHSLRHSLNRFSHNLKEVSTHTTHNVKWWHMLAIAILFGVLLWSMIVLVGIESHKCTIDQEELDSCAKRLTFFSRERKHFPANNQQLDTYCKEKTQSIQCLKRYVHSCLTVDKVQKRYVKKFVSNYRKQLDHTCLHRTEREKFMSYSSCLSDENLIKNATQCTESHQNRLLYIAQFVQDDLRIAAACCSLHLRHSCLNSLISDKCDLTAQQFVMDQTEGPYRSLISNVCSPYYLSVRACNNRIDPDVWRDMKLASVPTSTNSVPVLPEVPHQSNHSSNSTAEEEERLVVQDGQRLKAKLEQLKFQESFLAMIFIVRHD